MTVHVWFAEEVLAMHYAVCSVIRSLWFTMFAGYGPHNGHNCREGNRGSWIIGGGGRSDDTPGSGGGSEDDEYVD